MKNLYKKMHSIQGVAIKKDAKNPFFKSSYITLRQMVTTLAPMLEEQKLLVTHRTENMEVVTSVIDVETAESIESRFPMISSNDPQKTGSCITYAKRYNLGQLFNVTDEDDDGNKAAEKEWYTDKLFKELCDSGKLEGLNTEKTLRKLKVVYKVATKYEKMFDEFFAKK